MSCWKRETPNSPKNDDGTAEATPAASPGWFCMVITGNLHNYNSYGLLIQILDSAERKDIWRPLPDRLVYRKGCLQKKDNRE